MNKILVEKIVDAYYDNRELLILYGNYDVKRLKKIIKKFSGYIFVSPINQSLENVKEINIDDLINRNKKSMEKDLIYYQKQIKKLEKEKFISDEEALEHNHSEANKGGFPVNSSYPFISNTTSMAMNAYYPQWIYPTNYLKNKWETQVNEIEKDLKYIEKIVRIS